MKVVLLSYTKATFDFLSEAKFTDSGYSAKYTNVIALHGPIRQAILSKFSGAEFTVSDYLEILIDHLLKLGTDDTIFLVPFLGMVCGSKKHRVVLSKLHIELVGYLQTASFALAVHDDGSDEKNSSWRNVHSASMVDVYTTSWAWDGEELYGSNSPLELLDAAILEPNTLPPLFPMSTSGLIDVPNEFLPGGCLDLKGDPSPDPLAPQFTDIVNKHRKLYLEAEVEKNVYNRQSLYEFADRTAIAELNSSSALGHHQMSSHVSKALLAKMTGVTGWHVSPFAAVVAQPSRPGKVIDANA